jgi:hypothetical protein
MVGCGGGGASSTSDGYATTTNQYTFVSAFQRGSIQITLSAKGVSNQGDVVPVTIAISNIGANSLSMPDIIFPSVTVYKDNVVTRYLLLAGYSGSLAPGGTQTFNIPWDQKDLSNNLVAAGNYLIMDSNGDQISITIK